MSATALTAVSWARGTNITIAMPTSGMKTARVSAQSSNQSICGVSPTLRVAHCSAGVPASRTLAPPLALQDVDQVDRQPDQADAGQEQQRVALHPARLHLAQLATGRPRFTSEVVERAVDDFLVEHVVREAPRGRGAAPGAVDDTVDHVLVHPVRRARDRPLDAGDDDTFVEVVEVVLLLEEAVAGVRDLVAFGEALERADLFTLEPEVRGNADRDHGEADRRRREHVVEVGMDEVRERADLLDPLRELLDV